MRSNRPRLWAVLAVLGVGELLSLGAAEARAQWVVGPGWYGGRYKIKVKGRGAYPPPVVGVTPVYSSAYVVPSSVVVTETDVIQPAPVVQRRVIQPAPVVETRVIQPPPVVERRYVQPAPVVESAVIQTVPVLQRRVYTAYPY